MTAVAVALFSFLQVKIPTGINTDFHYLNAPDRSIFGKWIHLLTYAYYIHTINVEITWDAIKAKSNRLKHRIYFSEIESVFYDPNAIGFEDVHSKDESRYVVIGLDSLCRLIVVVYTYRGPVIRLISARKASKAEQQVYEKGIRF